MTHASCSWGLTFGFERWRPSSLDADEANRLAEGRGLFASPINVLIYQYGEVVLLEVLCLAEGALARQTRRAAGQAHPEVPAFNELPN